MSALLLVFQVTSKCQITYLLMMVPRIVWYYILVYHWNKSLFYRIDVYKVKEIPGVTSLVAFIHKPHKRKLRISIGCQRRVWGGGGMVEEVAAPSPWLYVLWIKGIFLHLKPALDGPKCCATLCFFHHFQLSKAVDEHLWVNVAVSQIELGRTEKRSRNGERCGTKLYEVTISSLLHWPSNLHHISVQLSSN